MSGTKDLILDLVESIEKQGHKYVVAIIKEDKDKQNIEIYTKIGENPLNSLLNVLREHQKTIKSKAKESKDVKDKLQ